MRGIGIQPAGTTPAGYGDPSHSEEDTSVILADAATGAPFGSRKIDPRTRDYVLDGESGRLLGMKNIQQLVQLAIANASTELQELDRLDSGFARAIEAKLRGAFAILIAQGLVEITGVNVRMNSGGGLKPGQAVAVLHWRDLTTGIEHEASV